MKPAVNSYLVEGVVVESFEPNLYVYISSSVSDYTQQARVLDPILPYVVLGLLVLTGVAVTV